MRPAIPILALILWSCSLGAPYANCQTPLYSALPPESSSEVTGETVDGIVARIEDDVLTESELRELAGFQQLVEGHVKPRSELIQELSDQWIVRGEAKATGYPAPTPDDVSRAYAQLMKQFASSEEFARRRAAAGLTDLAVKEMLEQQLYLSRFLDYRFRPAVQVGDQQIETYYKSELTPPLTAKGQVVPPLVDVTDTIREVIVQREIDERATKWLDDTRKALKIDMVSSGNDR